MRTQLTKIKLISMILFRELIRDKIFLSLSAASILLVFASLILNEMVVGLEIKATKDLGLSTLNIFSLFILIFLGVNQVSKDLGNKSLYFLFSKPVNRTHYILSGYISVVMAVCCGILVITGTIFLLSFLQGETWIPGLLTAGYLTLLEMSIILAFAILFALITSPQLAMFLTLLMYVIGHTLEQAAQIVAKSENVVLKYVVLLLHALLPNLEFFNKKPEIVYGISLPFSYFLNAALYSLSYTVLVFLISVRVFNKKEI